MQGFIFTATTAAENCTLFLDSTQIFQTQRKILTKSLEREMKVKGTGSRCLLEECFKDNYYARFHPHSYHCCKEMKFIPRLDANYGRTDGRTDERTDGKLNPYIAPC